MRGALVLLLLTSSCLGPRECRSAQDCLPNSFCEKPASAAMGVCREEGDGGRR